MVKSFDCLYELLNDVNIQVGDKCITYGFYEYGDGGNGEYLITNDATPDNITIFEVNGNYAVLLNSNKINAETIGIYPENEKPTGSLTNSQILNNFLTNRNGAEITFGSRVYDFNSTITLNNDIRNIKFIGVPNNQLLFLGEGNFIEYENANYIYFYNINFYGNKAIKSIEPYTRNCFVITVGNSYDFFFTDCKFLRFNKAVEYNALAWDGFFTRCIFRQCDSAIVFANAGTTKTVFDNCIIENCKDSYIKLSADNAGKIEFNSCMIEGGIPVSNKYLDCTGSTSLSISSCYFESSGSSENPVFSIFAPNANIKLFGNIVNAGSPVPFIYTKYGCGYFRGNLLCDNLKYFDDTQNFLFILSKNFNIPFVAYSEITDSLPLVKTGLYGNSINLGAYVSGDGHNEYSGETNIDNLKWRSEFYRNEKCNGRCFVVEYTITDINALKAASSVSMTVKLYDESIYQADYFGLNLFTFLPKNIFNYVTNEYKIYEIIPIKTNDIDSVNFTLMRQLDYLKATGVYII